MPDQRNDFSQGSIPKAILSLALPMTAAQLVNILYSVVDRIYLGRLPGTGHLALTGLGITIPIISILNAFANLCGMGGAPLCSIHRGKGEHEEAERVMGNSFTLLIWLGVLSMAVCFLAKRPMLYLFGASDVTFPYADEYLTIYLCGTLFVMISLGMNPFINSQGFGRTGMLTVVLGAVVNLVLDPIFIFALNMGVRGAALATVIAQGVSFLTALIYLCRNRERFGFDLAPRNFLIDPKELVTLIKLGVPFAIRQASVLISKFFVNYWINGYGVTVSAVSGVGYKLDVIGNLVGSAVTTAGSSMVGQNIGAGKYDRASRVLGSALLINGVFYSLMIAVFLLFPRFVFGCFTSDQSVLLVCMEYLPFLVVIYIASALRNSMHAFTFGCGNSKFNFCAAVLDAFVVRIGLSLLLGLAAGMGYRGFWAGSAAAGFVPFVLGAVYYLSGVWKKQSRFLASEKNS